MKYFNYMFFFLSVLLVQAQEVNRVEVQGRINVESDEKEGITVYNQNTNKGTTTDENGVFKIEVAVNDVVGFGALQFQDFTIIISDKIIASKQMSVRLVEDVNKLDEVIVLPYDLSGDLTADLDAVRTYNVDMDEVYKGEEDFDDYDMERDEKSRIEYDPVIDENRFTNGLNFVSLYNSFFKKKNKSKNNNEKFRETISPIEKRYSPEFLNTHFKIPTDLSEAFIDFVEEKDYDRSLLELKNEIQLLEFLNQQSQLFLLKRN